MTTGEKLAACRKEKNWTQEQLAEMLDVSRQSVSRWEMDAAFPETEKLIRLSRLFDCSIDYLLIGDRQRPEGENGVISAEEAVRFIRACGFFFLATLKDGMPNQRPMGMIGAYENAILIATDKRKQVYRELMETPAVSIAAYHMDLRKWIRISGRMLPETSSAAMEEMENIYPMIGQEYAGTARKELILFRLQADEIQYK